jgi:hypothetical protein
MSARARIMGYDIEIWVQIIPVLYQDKGQNCRQIQNKLGNTGLPVVQQKLASILDDMESVGKIKKQYENGKPVFLSA